MIKKTLCSCAAPILGLTLSALFAPTLSGQTEPAAPRFAVGVEGGTAGIGPVVVLTASPRFTATVGYTWLDWDYDVEDEDGDYDGKLKFSNLQAMLNWHPWAATFHVSAGVFVSDNKVDVTGKPNANTTYEIGGTTYSAAEVGTLRGNVELADSVAPYIGVGWSKNPLDGGWGFFASVGVFFANSPEARLSANGPISDDPDFQRNLREEERDLNEELDNLRTYPVIQFGALYRF